MALFDFLKKRKKGETTPKRAQDKARRDDAQKDAKSGRGLSARGVVKGEKTEVKPIVLKTSRIAWRVLREPHVTEKSTNLSAFNQYVFKAVGRPSKMEMKKAIEEIYGVHVDRVRKIAIPRKKRKRRKQIGWRPGYTKAIATLRPGEKIEVLPH